jgi:hypothetical protein
MAGRGSTPQPPLPETDSEMDQPAVPTAPVVDEVARGALRQVREQLRELLTLLERNDKKRA